jgi:hypothetical protein
LKQQEASAEGSDGGDSGGTGEGENNTGNKEPNYTDLWNNEPSPGDNPATPAAQPVVAAQPAAQTPDQAFNAHIDSLRLTGEIDFREITEQMQQGNSEGLQSAMQQVAANSYRAATISANKLVQSKVDAAVKSAVEEASGNMDATMAVREMNNSLPFTASEGFAPVAKAVLTQFIRKGSSIPDAIGEVQKYFSHMVKSASGDLDLQLVNGAAETNGQFMGSAGAGATPGSESEPADWLDFFGVPTK